MRPFMLASDRACASVKWVKKQMIRETPAFAEATAWQARNDAKRKTGDGRINAFWRCFARFAVTLLTSWPRGCGISAATVEHSRSHTLPNAFNYTPHEEGRI